MKPFLHVSLLILTGCVKSYVEPGERIFPPGSYEYSARVLLPESADSADFLGRLEISEVTPDSLVGRWVVPGYAQVLGENHFNVVSYNVHARHGAGADSVTMIHSIRRDDASAGPSCRVRARRAGYLSEGRCELVPIR